MMPKTQCNPSNSLPPIIPFPSPLFQMNHNHVCTSLLITSEVWEDPDANLRVLGPLPRFTDAWKRLYKLRMSIERIFRSFKHSRGLEGHCVRGLRKITLHATLSVLTYQATVLARLRAGEPDKMRQMTVKVA